MPTITSLNGIYLNAKNPSLRALKTFVLIIMHNFYILYI